MIDLLEGKKGIRVFTDFEEYIGNYTITVSASMERYPTKSVEYEFVLYI